ncbi:MAG: hypothetical protein ABW220_01165, partial [Burkholderiaceae bacterium]
MPLTQAPLRISQFLDGNFGANRNVFRRHESPPRRRIFFLGGSILRTAKPQAGERKPADGANATPNAARACLSFAAQFSEQALAFWSFGDLFSQQLEEVGGR